MSSTDPTPTAPTRSSRRLVKTSTPGIYRRLSRSDGTPCGYVVIYRAAGSQRKETARTLAEARAIRSARLADVERGEFQAPSKIAFRAFLAEWIDRYAGNGKAGFREGTRTEYRRLLDNYAHRYFGERLRLVDVSPRHLAEFVAWLSDEGQQGRRLADSTIANAVIPVRAALSTAKAEGLIRHNPADGLRLPHRAEVRDDDDEDAKALSREQLATVLALTPGRHRTLLELLAGTGLRVGEALALQRQHLALDGARPRVRVRRALRRGRIEAPKSRHGRRDVPLSRGLVDRLRAHLADLPDVPETLVFVSVNGTALDADNLRARTVKPLMEEAGAPWAAFHTLRHTYASLQLAAGANVVQLSRALGHHSASFTLDVYAHLLDGEDAPALDLSVVLEPAPLGATLGQRKPPNPDALGDRVAAPIPL
jgi:integrase